MDKTTTTEAFSMVFMICAFTAMAIGFTAIGYHMGQEDIKAEGIERGLIIDFGNDEIKWRKI